MSFEEWWNGNFHYIESWKIAGVIKHNANEAWNAAIDEAVKVVKADYIGTDEMYEQDCIGLVEKIKELKQ